MNRYLVAVLLTAAAVVLRLALDQLLGPSHHPFVVLFSGAAVAAAWYGGFRAGLLSTVLGSLAVLYLFIEPKYSVRVERVDDFILLLSYAVASLFGSWLCENLHAARRQADDALAERRRADEQMRESEERLRLAKAAAALGVHDYDVLANRIGWDERVRELWGVSPDEPITYDTFLTGLHPDDRAATQAAVDRAFDPKGDGHYYAEYRVVNRTDGVTRWVAATGTTLFVDGQAVRLVGTVQDITARKQTEGELRASEERNRRQLRELDALYRTAPVGMWLGDRECRFLRVNEVMAGINGHPAEAHIGKTVRELVPGVADVIEPHYQRVLASRQPVLDFTVVGSTAGQPGAVREWVVSYHPLLGEDGEVAAVSGIVREVTAQRQAERRVRDSEQRLRLAMEAAATGLWEWDVATNAVVWSQECYPIHGLREGEFDGTAAGFDRLLHPDDRGRVWATVRAAVDARTKYECEFRIVRPGGDVRWVANVGRAVGDEWGRPVRMVGTLTDITERKQAERQLLEGEERLRLALVAAKAGAWAWDVPTGRIDWSPENYALYGYDPAGGPPAYADWEGRIHPDDREGANAAVRAALDRRADGFRAEYRVVHPTLGVRWLVGIGEVEFGPTGEPVRMAGINLDITDRKEAEERLRQSEVRLRLALTAARMVVWEWTPGDGKLRVSENAADVFGLPAGVGLTGIDQGIALLHPDDVAAYRATFQQAIDGRDSYLTHYRLVRPNDGRVIWVEERGHTVFDQPGGAVRLYGVATDVTARRDAEEQQRASETFARQVSDVAPSILYVYDLDERRNVWANRETFGGLGYSREQLDAMSGHLLATLLHPDDLTGYEAHAARLHVLADGEVAEFEYRLRAADGSDRWLVSRDMPFRRHAGRVTQIIGAALDITARKRSEEEAETSRRTLHALVEQCPFGIYIVDADFRIASVNAGSVDKAFANVRPLIGRPFEEAMRIIWPEPVATEVLAVFRRTLATGEAYRSADFVNPRADIDQTEGYEWELHRLTLPNGRYGVVCYYYDSTRLRLAQQALQEADQKKDEFLATLAHELRNPLAPIQNGVQIIKMSEPNGAVGKTLDTMDRQLGHLVRLIDDLLDVSRITRGKMHLQRERVPLSAVIDAAVEATLPLVARNRHELTVRPLPDVWLDGDPTRLAQIISNLLTNAAKYTQRGGRITLTAKVDGGEVVVSVKDTGIGIPPLMLTRVFEMFSQVDRALEKTTGGLGIGLSLVRGLVEMHGGTISAHSEGEGKGSEFTVRLPATAGTGEGQTMNGTTLMATGRKLTILVVDDNEDAAESMATMLEMFGHEVRTAFDGEAGVAAAGEFRPQVAFLDIGMPKVNGYDAARRIRAEEWGKDMLLVALTGWGSDDDKRKTGEAGFDRHLTKPVNPQALTKLLAEVVPVGA